MLYVNDTLGSIINQPVKFTILLLFKDSTQVLTKTSTIKVTQVMLAALSYSFGFVDFYTPATHTKIVIGESAMFAIHTSSPHHKGLYS